MPKTLTKKGGTGQMGDIHGDRDTARANRATECPPPGECEFEVTPKLAMPTFALGDAQRTLS